MRNDGECMVYKLTVPSQSNSDERKICCVDINTTEKDNRLGDKGTPQPLVATKKYCNQMSLTQIGVAKHHFVDSYTGIFTQFKATAMKWNYLDQLSSLFRGK